MITATFVDHDKRMIGFKSDAADMAMQIQDLQQPMAEDDFVSAARKELHMAAPGISDRSIRYLDNSSGEFLSRNLQPDDNGKVTPVACVTFDTLN